jgi:hypothetical protein
MPNTGYASFSITPSGANAIDFGDISSRGSRSALYSMSGVPEYDYNVWHIPGTQGNVVCNLGEAGRTVLLVGVYIGTYPDILITYEDDKIAMTGVPCDVYDCAGKTHERCRLKSSTEAGPPKGTTFDGANASAFFIAHFVFERHGETR